MDEPSRNIKGIDHRRHVQCSRRGKCAAICEKIPPHFPDVGALLFAGFEKGLDFLRVHRGGGLGSQSDIASYPGDEA